MRDRVVELLDEEAALATSLAETWRDASEPAPVDAQSVPRLHAPFDRLLAKTQARVASVLAVTESPGQDTVRVTGWPAALGDAAPIARRVGEVVRRGAAVIVAASGAGAAARLAEVLESSGVEVGRDFELVETAAADSLRRPGVHVVVATLDRGFVMEAIPIAVLAESDLTGRHRPHRVPKARSRPVEGFFDDLAPGDYVVHYVHGVARYAGMVTRGDAGQARDYLLLEYRGGDRVYVPSDQIDFITPYTGGENPTLSRLSGNDWQKQRARARRVVRAVAEELIELYRRRLASEGHAFAPDSPWQSELEQAFPYPETPDQLRAIVDVKEDMERPVPMDRLVCGDVGFGKTEVALRAAFKGVQDGRQVAVLVPTTILARQHFETFAERFAPYPVRVAMLSRFLTPKEQSEVVAGIGDGSVDVVIGTHRLLGDDVVFRRLGLLVVDEEQRFGVHHKEAVKRLSIGVDVLTLTASPIPRTLEMALTGIRDLSLIDTPPAERQPILTYVGEYDDRAVAEAIRRELLREGQVFFVHNRVHDIERVASHVRELVPAARVAVAHGQMDEGTLEKTVLDFSEGEYDVLVCTTIIESGIDMPQVNTLVVDRADMLGLGQLHQLRGRVGRSAQRAYAYLLHPRDRTLTEQAYERLRTIGEHTELGSGFKIAMRDLRDPRRGQPRRHRPVGSHRRGRLRPVRADGRRGGRRGEGRDPHRAGRGPPRHPDRRQPADQLRRARRPPLGGVPPPRRRARRRRGRRHRHRVARPLRSAAETGRGAHRCRAPSCRVRARRHPRGRRRCPPDRVAGAVPPGRGRRAALAGSPSRLGKGSPAAARASCPRPRRPGAPRRAAEGRTVRATRACRLAARAHPARRRSRGVGLARWPEAPIAHILAPSCARSFPPSRSSSPVPLCSRRAMPASCPLRRGSTAPSSARRH